MSLCEVSRGDSIAPGASESTGFDVSLFAKKKTLTEKCFQAGTAPGGAVRARVLLGHSPHGCEAETGPSEMRGAGGRGLRGQCLCGGASRAPTASPASGVSTVTHSWETKLGKQDGWLTLASVWGGMRPSPAFSVADK